MQQYWSRSNFTLHYGLRYEVNTPFDNETNQLGNFDRNYPGGRLVVQGTKGLSLVNPLWRVAVGNTPPGDPSYHGAKNYNLKDPRVIQ